MPRRNVKLLGNLQLGSKMQAKIPVTIGFGNPAPVDYSKLIRMDSAAIGPLFDKVRTEAFPLSPCTELLFAYGDLDEEGRFGGPKPTTVWEVAEKCRTRIFILASPNSPATTQKALMARPKNNAVTMVLTVKRNGEGFARFFCDLFELMRKGESFPMAWVMLAPQLGTPSHPKYEPFAAAMTFGGRQLVFPRSKPDA